LPRRVGVDRTAVGAGEDAPEEVEAGGAVREGLEGLEDPVRRVDLIRRDVQVSAEDGHHRPAEVAVGGLPRCARRPEGDASVPRGDRGIDAASFHLDQRPGVGDLAREAGIVGGGGDGIGIVDGRDRLVVDPELDQGARQVVQGPAVESSPDVPAPGDAQGRWAWRTATAAGRSVRPAAAIASP
jgi:hypothetical protein